MRGKKYNAEVEIHSIIPLIICQLTDEITRASALHKSACAVQSMLLISLGLAIKFQWHQQLRDWRKSVVVLTTHLKNHSSKALLPGSKHGAGTQVACGCAAC